MKLISKLVVLAAVGLMTSAVSAGTLYWQVTPDMGVNFTTAKIVVTQGGSQVTTLGETFATDIGDGDSGTYVSMQQTDLGSYSSNDYSFFVEMVNYATDPETVTQGATYSYQDLLSAGYVSFGPDDVTAVTIAATAGNMGSAIPEPSSGLLLLMGGAMLALRRRRQK